MARKSRVSQLPASVRQWLEKALIDRNFSGYAELEALLREQGYVLSRSGIHRYGQQVERRMAAIKASTEASRLITEAAADDKDARSEALHALVQTELFETILNLQEASDEEVDPKERVKLLSAAAKNIATLTRANVTLKRYQAELAIRVQAAANDAGKLAIEGGLSPDRAQAIVNRILGVVP